MKTLLKQPTLLFLIVLFTFSAGAEGAEVIFLDQTQNHMSSADRELLAGGAIQKQNTPTKVTKDIADILESLSSTNMSYLTHVKGYSTLGKGEKYFFSVGEDRIVQSYLVNTSSQTCRVDFHVYIENTRCEAHISCAEASDFETAMNPDTRTSTLSVPQENFPKGCDVLENRSMGDIIMNVLPL